MSSKKVEAEIIEVEHQLNLDIVHKLSDKIEHTINSALESEQGAGRIELLAVLLSFASQVSIETGIEKESYMDMVRSFYCESEDMIEGEDGLNWN
jgi:hypothetical protein